MKFYPKRKLIAFLAILSFAVCTRMMFLSLQSFSFVTFIPGIIFFGLFVFFIVPFMKNQMVEVTEHFVILYNFGKPVELRPDELIGIVERKKGVLSYRFQKGDSRFQISPYAYYDDKLLQSKFSKLFGEFLNIPKLIIRR